MREKKGLSRTQKIFIVALWVLLCVILFTIPNGKPLGENIIYAVLSGVIILVGVTSGKNTMDKIDRKNRRRKR